MSLVNQCPAARSLARSRSRYLEVIRPVAYLARIRPFPSPRAWPDLLGAVNYRLRPCFYADRPMFLSQSNWNVTLAAKHRVKPSRRPNSHWGIKLVTLLAVCALTSAQDEER